MDILWLAIAYGKMNKRVDGIESMFKWKKRTKDLINYFLIRVLKRFIDDTTTTNIDRSILLTFLGLYQHEIDPQTAVKHIFKRFYYLN